MRVQLTEEAKEFLEKNHNGYERFFDKKFDVEYCAKFDEYLCVTHDNMYYYFFPGELEFLYVSKDNEV